MDSGSASALPDYERMAAVFDRHLLLIEPVGAAVLRHLPSLTAGALVLDVACGTGEPGLTLLRRAPGVRLLGVDAAVGMIELARAKAARAGLSNARFEVMSAESLGCADGSVDVLLSRFGLLMFGDVAASAGEMARVLRPGGCYSLAVWDDMEKNTLVKAVLAALRPRVPTELGAPFERVVGGAAGEALHAAGLPPAQSEPFSWDYEFASETALWEFVSGPGMFTRMFAALGEKDHEAVRVELSSALGTYRQTDASYRVPHTCRLWWGRR